MISAGVPKGFFGAIQKDKQRLIDDLKVEQKSHDEIVNAVSERVLSWLEEGETSDPAEIVIPLTDQDEPTAIEIQPQQNDVSPPSVKPIEHKHWSGNPTAALEKQPTEDEIWQEFIAVGRLLIEIAEDKEIATQKRMQSLSDQIFRQSRLITTAKPLVDATEYQPGGTTLMGEFINSGWQLLQAEKALKRLPFNPELPLKCTSREFNIAAKPVMESALVLQPYIPDIVIGLDFPIKELKDVESPEAEFLYKLGYNVPWTIQSSAWWKELTPTDRMISQLFRRFIKSR